MRRFAALLVLTAGALVLAPAPASADLPPGATWTALVNGRPIETSTSRDPVRLEPGVPATVSVTVQNHSARPISARYVRLSGSVLGLAFYVYTTRVDLDAAPGAEVPREFPIDLLDLGRQASGLIPSRISLLDAAGTEIDGKDLRVDVRGELNSVYSTFGIAIALLSLVLLASALWRLARGRLHPNRWRRGLTLAAPGLGIGFLVTFTLSALRVLSPVATLWGSLLLAGAVIGFAAGYLSPTPTGAQPDEPDPGPDPDADFREYDGDATDPGLLGRHAGPQGR